MTAEIEFREDFSNDIEVLGASKIGLRCELSYGISEKCFEDIQRCGGSVQEPFAGKSG